MPNRAHGMKWVFLSGEGEGGVGGFWGVIIWQIREEAGGSCIMGVYLPLAGTHGILSFQQT